MQTLSRLSLRRRGSARAVAAWLAIAALIGTLAGPAPARASCAGQAAGAATTCSHCRHVAHAVTPTASRARCALATTPCCRCAISADREPASTTTALQLERPASQAHALPVALATARGDVIPQTSRSLTALGPPGAPPGSGALTTILRL